VGRGMPPLGVTILCHARVMSDSQAPPTQSRELWLLLVWARHRTGMGKEQEHQK